MARFFFFLILATETPAPPKSSADFRPYGAAVRVLFNDNVSSSRRVRRPNDPRADREWDRGFASVPRRIGTETVSRHTARTTYLKYILSSRVSICVCNALVASGVPRAGETRRGEKKIRFRSKSAQNRRGLGGYVFANMKNGYNSNRRNRRIEDRARAFVDCHELVTMYICAYVKS